MIFTIIKYLLAILGIILLYEFIRGFVKSGIIKRLNKSIKRYISEYNIKLDKYKFMNKFIVRQEMMNDSEIHKGILAHARENDITIQDATEQVEEYIDEIIPFFNLLSYYKFGYRIADFLLNMIYEVVIDHENSEKLKKIPDDAAVVFLMNHRSNVDYLIVAYMLAKNISISYAVGEWARVWPLEFIFKSFGAYFLRRKYRVPLYHLVLEKYVQLISLKGITQGVFIEGALTRDGKFRDTKIGIIDYIIRIKKDPNFMNDVVFVPVGINYDWVIEDTTLIKEWKKRKEKSRISDHFFSLLKIVGKGPLVLIINLFRYMTGNLKNHGYASVSFGDPISISAFLEKQKQDIFKLDRRERLAVVKEFANNLQAHIGKVVPVTPLCLTAMAIFLLKENTLTKIQVIKKINEIKKQLYKNKNRVVIGKAFKDVKDLMEHIEEERSGRKKELVTFEEELVDSEESEVLADVGLAIMKRRKWIRIKDQAIIIDNKYIPYIEYYANSIAHLIKL